MALIVLKQESGMQALFLAIMLRRIAILNHIKGQELNLTQELMTGIFLQVPEQLLVNGYTELDNEYGRAFTEENIIYSNKEDATCTVTFKEDGKTRGKYKGFWIGLCQ